MLTLLARMACVSLAGSLAACGGKSSLDTGGSGGAGGDGGAGAGPTVKECIATGGAGATSPIFAGVQPDTGPCAEKPLSYYTDFQLEPWGFRGCVPELGEYVVESVLFDRVTLVGTTAVFHYRELSGQTLGAVKWFAPGDVVVAGNRAYGPIPDGWEFLVGESHTVYVGGPVPGDIPGDMHIELKAYCSNPGCTPCGEPRRPEAFYRIWVSGFEGPQAITAASVATNNWLISVAPIVQLQTYCSPECGTGVEDRAQMGAVGPFE